MKERSEPRPLPPSGSSRLRRTAMTFREPKSTDPAVLYEYKVAFRNACQVAA